MAAVASVVGPLLPRNNFVPCATGYFRKNQFKYWRDSSLFADAQPMAANE